jgi:glucokinase
MDEQLWLDIEQIQKKENMKDDLKPFALGLDIGGTNSVLGIVDREGQVRCTTSIKTQAYLNMEDYMDACVKAANTVIAQVGGIEKINGMGIGAPSANPYRGTIEHAANLAWAQGVVPLAEVFMQRLGIHVGITNDANAAAMGEMKYGVAKGMKNFVEITLGTGVGSGIIVNGQLLYGCDGLAGEVGHVIVTPGGRSCGCGRKGCLETYCSATGIVRTARELLEQGYMESSLRDIPLEELTSLDLFKAAKRGDALALQVFKDTGTRLGEACANLAAVLSPEAFVFFGGLASAGDVLMEPVRKAYDENVLSLYRGKAQFLQSGLADANAAILGASALGWEV